MKELNIVAIWRGMDTVILTKDHWEAILDILKDYNLKVNNVWSREQLERSVETSSAIER